MVTHEDEFQPASQAVDSECVVLSTLLCRQDALCKVVGQINETDWYRPAHKHIYRAISCLFNENAAVDLTTVKSTLEKQDSLSRAGGLAYLNQLALGDTTVVEGLAHHVNRIKEAAHRRRLETTRNELDAVLSDTSKTPAQLAALAATKYQALSVSTEAAASPQLVDIAREVYDAIDDRYTNKGKPQGLPTGLPTLDRCLKGGLKAGQLIVIAARPAVGKSALATNIGYNVAKVARAPVVLFSLEMSREEIVERILAGETDIDSQLLGFGELDSTQWGKLTHAIEVFNQVPLFIFDQSSGIQTLQAMEATLRRIEVDYGVKPQVMIADYVQLMSMPTNRKNETRAALIGEVVRDMKLLAGKLGMAVIALSQLNRESVKRDRPIMSDLKDSGCIEDHANTVLLIHKFAGDEHPQQIDAELIVAKNRNAPTPTINMYWKAHCTTFIEA